MEKNFNLNVAEFTRDFKYWLEQKIHDWDKTDIEYVAKDPDNILDPRFLVDFVDEYPQYFSKVIFDNYEKFSDLVVEVYKKFI